MNDLEETILTMIHKLWRCAEKRWRKIKRFDHLALLIEGKTFKDGVLEDNSNRALTDVLKNQI